MLNPDYLESGINCSGMILFHTIGFEIKKGPTPNSWPRKI